MIGREQFLFGVPARLGVAHQITDRFGRTAAVAHHHGFNRRERAVFVHRERLNAHVAPLRDDRADLFQQGRRHAGQQRLQWQA